MARANLKKSKYFSTSTTTTVPDESYGFLADLLIDGHV